MKIKMHVVCIQTFLKSLFDKVSTNLVPEEKNPPPRGLYATIPMPSSLSKKEGLVRN